MSNPSQVANALKSISDAQTVESIVEKYHKNLAEVLPRHMNVERVKGIVMNAIRTNPKILQCTPESFLGAVFALAQLGLEPIGGRAYLVPYQNKRKVGNDWKTFNEIQALIGYQGFVDLFYRHHSSLAIKWGIVCQNDFFEYEYGTSQFLKHRPALNDRGEAAGYYVIATLKGNVDIFQVMSKGECIEHGKKHSKTWISSKWENGAKVSCDPHFDEKSPWATNLDSMCLKTVLRQLSKLLPLSVELQRAFEVDETSRDIKEDVRDVFSVPVTNAWEAEGGDPKIEKPQASTPGGLT